MEGVMEGRFVDTKKETSWRDGTCMPEGHCWSLDPLAQGVPGWTQW